MRTHLGLIHKLRKSYEGLWEDAPPDCAFELSYDREHHAVAVHCHDPRLERMAEKLRAFLNLAIDLAEGVSRHPKMIYVRDPRNARFVGGAVDDPEAELSDHQIVLVTHAEFVAARARGDVSMKYRRIESYLQDALDPSPSGYERARLSGLHCECFICEERLGGMPASFIVSMPLPHDDEVWSVWCACGKCTETQDVLGHGIEAETFVNGLGRLVEPDEDQAA
jgi:hypothetical protein